ncbi:unnamed protein product [Pedinophyceae sp. YPF-701]|nr:unnamed protein product [Pedinophyceae sp. YPF-701]
MASGGGDARGRRVAFRLVTGKTFHIECPPGCRVDQAAALLGTATGTSPPMLFVGGRKLSPAEKIDDLGIDSFVTAVPVAVSAPRRDVPSADKAARGEQGSAAPAATRHSSLYEDLLGELEGAKDAPSPKATPQKPRDRPHGTAPRTSRVARRLLAPEADAGDAGGGAEPAPPKRVRRTVNATDTAGASPATGAGATPPLASLVGKPVEGPLGVALEGADVGEEAEDAIKRFTAMSAAHDLLLRHRVQPTTCNLAAATAAALGDGRGATADHVRTLARACPGSIYLGRGDRSEGGTGTNGVMAPAWCNACPDGCSAIDLPDPGLKAWRGRGGAPIGQHQRRVAALRQALAVAAGLATEGRRGNSLAALAAAVDAVRPKQKPEDKQEEGGEARDDAARQKAEADDGAPVSRALKAAVSPQKGSRHLRGAPDDRKCTGTEAIACHALLDHLRDQAWYQDQIVCVQDVPPRLARFAETAVPLPDVVLKALSQRGAPKLFVHQARAINAVMSGRHVVVCTGTSSGKSLCYNVPIVAALESEPETCALFMYPTKALAQDQLQALRGLVRAAFGDKAPAVEIYDGDTPMSERPILRQRAQLLLTNPDMLHRTILPDHASFTRFLANLRFVVCDEGHSYQGVFGSHTALVLRRLRRICEQTYSRKPVFIVTSATIANPEVHSARLIGDPAGVEVISEDGSPCGAKKYVLWNPPLTAAAQRLAAEAAMKKAAKARRGEGAGADSSKEAELLARAALGKRHGLEMAANANSSPRKAYRRVSRGGRRVASKQDEGGGVVTPWGTDPAEKRCSPIVEIATLLVECIQHNLRTIAFCRSRKMCELVTAYAREALQTTAPHLVNTVSVYRAGYAAQDRRDIERALFGGRLRGVAATNALELGVDVGDLDVTLHLGLTGSAASLKQQAGRSGRRGQDSLAVFIGFDSPLDQYFMSDPQRLFSLSVEAACIDPENPQLLEQHIRCAANEQPLVRSVDAQYFGAFAMRETVDVLIREGWLRHAPDSGRPGSLPQLRYIGAAANPAADIGLRSIDPERYIIVDEATGIVLEEIESSKAFFEVYDGAVYMYQGRTYLCKKVDLETHVATVRQADVKYYTRPRDRTRVYVQGGTGNAAYSAASAAVFDDPGDITTPCAGCTVVTHWDGFNRIWRGSGVVFDSVDLHLPDSSFDTLATYIRVPHEVRKQLTALGFPFSDSLHAAAHATLAALPLLVTCSPTDMGAECGDFSDRHYRPERLLLFDKNQGGVGLARQASKVFGKLLQRAIEIISGCPCTAVGGCPGCVHLTECRSYNGSMNKEGGVVVLQAILKAHTDGKGALGGGETPAEGDQVG